MKTKKKTVKYELAPKPPRTPKQVAKRKATKSAIERAKRRAELPGNKKRAEEQAAALEVADTAKMQEKMEAPIPESSVDPITAALVPGQDVQTTQL